MQPRWKRTRRFLFVLIAQHPDVTLGEIVAAMHE
jgi:hypothetical protein